MNDKYKEYHFEEWIRLSEKDKIDIVNQYWSPFNPKIGQKTRQLIKENFLIKYSDKIKYCEFKYFGFYAFAMFVIPFESKTKIPNLFAGITINKGKLLKNVQPNVWKVKWNHSGPEELKI